MAEQSTGKTSPETSRFVHVQGARMHYVHAGSGRPLLLLHGLTGSAANWRRNIAALARTASVYALDLLNMGQSDRIPGIDAGLAATADRVAAFMDAAGIDRADIAGHSHGGAVAMMLAIRHPKRVARLLLFAPANPYCSFGHRLLRLYSSAPGRLLARAIPYLPARIHTIALGRMYGEPARIVEGTLAGYTDGLRIPGSIQHVLAIVRGWHADMAELRASLSSIAAPVLLIWGDRDRAVSLTSGQTLRRKLPQSAWAVVPTAGHVVFEEMPEETNAIVLDWLGRSDAIDPPVVPARRMPSVSSGRPVLVPSLQQLSRGA